MGINLFSHKKDKKQLENKLKESELRYRRLFESAKDGILILDFETGQIVDANPFILNIIDNSLNEVIGKKLWEIGLFSNKLLSKFAYLNLKKSGYIRFEDMPIQRENGKITEVEFVSNVYLVNNTKVIQCNIRNITERKESERKHELLTKILLILNKLDDWKLVIKNIMIEAMNFIKMDTIGIHLIKNDKDYSNIVAIGLPNSVITEKYFYEKNKLGEYVFNQKGSSFLNCVIGIVVLGLTDPSLPYFTKGGSFYSNNLPELLKEIGVKSKKTTTSCICNPKEYQTAAIIPLFSGKEVIGVLQFIDKRPNLLTLETIQLFEEIGNSVGIAFNRIQGELKILESEQILRKQNEDYFNLNQKNSILNEELTSSIDHIQNVNEELIKQKAKAEESDKLKSSFLANMSHEIFTPMNSIMGFSDLLLHPDLSTKKIAQFVQMIHSSSKQLMSIISDLVDISTIEAGQIKIHSELVDIKKLLNEIYIIYRELINSKKISLNYKFLDTNKVKTDGNRIRQILYNLLNNAIKFTKEGSIEFGNKMVDINGHSYLQFYVKDTGIGIAPENQELVFERFRQIETSNSLIYGGNGLGLSISKALVEKLGGEILVESELGKGSTFSFTIPYNEGIENFVSDEFKTKSNGFNWPNKTILIVEDEINSYSYLEELLSETNVKIIHAFNGKQALENVENDSEISLVLMDIKLPVMDGYEATQLIKKIRPKLPIIAQTAFAQNNERINAFEAGCDNYLAKPIDKDIFMKVIGNYLS
jgi:PAS domain S-box-containing protein